MKLVPLIFIPYLLVTRKFRQAGMACAGFACTVLAGFVILPEDSAKYWFGGLFASSGRTGFVGWEGNQSLDALCTRLAGSITAGKPVWLVAAILAVAAGLYTAMLFYRAGHRLPAMLVTGLTGDLVSPVSWDHHWVWIVPGAVIAGHYAVAAWQAGKRQLAGVYTVAIAMVLAIFACWPGSWLHTPKDAPYQFGLIWLPPQTSPFGPKGSYVNVDKPWFYEYQWHGLQLLTGNAYVLAGIAVLFAMLLVALTLPVPPIAPGSDSATAAKETAGSWPA